MVGFSENPVRWPCIWRCDSVWRYDIDAVGRTAWRCVVWWRFCATKTLARCASRSAWVRSRRAVTWHWRCRLWNKTASNSSTSVSVQTHCWRHEFKNFTSSVNCLLNCHMSPLQLLAMFDLCVDESRDAMPPEIIEHDHVTVIIMCTWPTTGPSDIANGNVKLNLGLLWSLIRHYQIGSQSKLPPKKLMLSWVNAVIHPHRRITNFGADWNDGIALQYVWRHRISLILWWSVFNLCGCHLAK